MSRRVEIVFNGDARPPRRGLERTALERLARYFRRRLAEVEAEIARFR